MMIRGDVFSMKDDKNFVKQIVRYIGISLILLLVFNAVIMPMIGNTRIVETNYSFFLSQIDEGKSQR